MSDTHSVVYVPRPDATPEAERAVLTACYGFILRCHAQKKTAEASSESSCCDDPAIVRDGKEVTM
jgi:hypothetical protein